MRTQQCFIVCVYGYFCVVTAEMNSCNIHWLAHKAQNTYYVGLYGKSFLTPGIDYRFKKLRFRESNNLPKAILWFPDFFGPKVYALNHYSKYLLDNLSILMLDSRSCGL